MSASSACGSAPTSSGSPGKDRRARSSGTTRSSSSCSSFTRTRARANCAGRLAAADDPRLAAATCEGAAPNASRAKRTAEALGRDQLFRCSHLQLPGRFAEAWATGSCWPGPSFLSACIEAVDVFSLDEDLAMEVSVHPHPARSSDELRGWLEQCRDLLAASLGQGKQRRRCEDGSQLSSGRQPGLAGVRCSCTLEGGPKTTTSRSTRPNTVTQPTSSRSRHAQASSRRSPKRRSELLEHLPPDRSGASRCKESKLARAVFGGPGRVHGRCAQPLRARAELGHPGPRLSRTGRPDAASGSAPSTPAGSTRTSGSTLRLVGVERPDRRVE